MGPVKIVVVDANLPAVRTELEAALPPGTQVVWHRTYDAAAVAADLAGAEVLVSSRYTAALRGAAGALRLVQAPSAGVDGVDLASLPEGVPVANTFHHEESMAEQVVASVVVLIGLPTLFSTPGDKNSVLVPVPEPDVGAT